MEDSKRCPWCGRALDDDMPQDEPFLHDGYVVKNNTLLKYYGKPRGRVVLLPNVAETISQFAISGSDITTVIVPEGAKELGSSCFSHCIHLETVTLPNSLEKIGSGAFCKCFNLEELNIPDSVTVIESQFISECRSLESITLPPNLEIGDWIFDKASVKSVVISANQLQALIDRALRCYSAPKTPRRRKNNSRDEIEIDEVFRELEGTDKLSREQYCPFGNSAIERLIVGGTAVSVDDIVDKLTAKSVSKAVIFEIICDLFTMTPMLRKSKFYQLEKELRA